MSASKLDWIGVDYGSKLAGTTAICYKSDKGLAIRQSEKKSDADVFLSDFINEHQPTVVYLDAPLSLPSVYTSKGEDYFYRSCDRLTKAMSPMFLGGLTARAMRLSASFPEIEFRECYPGYFVRNNPTYSEFYLKKKPYTDTLEIMLSKAYVQKLTSALTNWHQLDAFICYLIGVKQGLGAGNVLGDAEEGLIYV